jgi:hypothetical protein
MAGYLGGKSDKFKGLIKKIETAWIEVDRMRGVAQLSTTLEGLQGIKDLGDDNKKLSDSKLFPISALARNFKSLSLQSKCWRR